MSIPLIEAHYVANRSKLLKRMSFRAPTPEEAEDIVQETYYRALKYADSYNGQSLDNWISTIAKNCLRESRNMNSVHEVEEFIEDESEGTACPSYPDHIMREIYELINTKAVHQIEILNLHFQQGYNSADINRITQHSYAVVNKCINRFREELKHLYK